MAEYFLAQVVAKREIGGQARAMVVTSSTTRCIEYFHTDREALAARKSPYGVVVAFSGDQEYKGLKVTEASLSGFPPNAIAEQVKTDPFRILATARESELDSVDWEILELLQVDATMPNKDVATKVGVAPSTCLERIRRMCRNGTIVATRAHMAPSLLGKGEQAFLGIQIRPHVRDTANDLALALPETLALYNVSGSEDYLVHVAVTNSTELQTLIIDKPLALPQVAHCRTQLIFGEPWVAPLRHCPSAGASRG